MAPTMVVIAVVARLTRIARTNPSIFAVASPALATRHLNRRAIHPVQPSTLTISVRVCPGRVAMASCRAQSNVTRRMVTFVTHSACWRCRRTGPARPIRMVPVMDAIVVAVNSIQIAKANPSMLANVLRVPVMRRQAMTVTHRALRLIPTILPRVCLGPAAMALSRDRSVATLPTA